MDLRVSCKSTVTHGMGIVGAGMIADFHARAIGALPNARLVGVFDQVWERARVLAQKYGVRAYTSLEEFLSDPAINVVTVSTPSGSHMETAVAAARHGKHVICEKPIDVTLERIDAMIAAHREAGTALGGIFNKRYEAVNQFVKRAVSSGRFGKIIYGGGYVPWFRSQEYYQQGGWRGTWKLDGGGALMNQGTHEVDLLQWFVGAPVRRVTAMTAQLSHTSLEVEDTAAAVLQFEGGALGMLFATTAVWPGMPSRVELGGSTGTVIADATGLKVLACATPDAGDEQALRDFGTRVVVSGACDPRAISPDNHRQNFAEFLRALDLGQEPELSGWEARKAVEIVLAAYRSAQTGLPVDLPGDPNK